MKRTLFILAGLLAIPACVLAQPLPIMPPTNYDTGGLNPAGAVTGITYYSTVAGTNRDMEVYTPPNYDPSQKYGVIYGIHGVSAWADTIFASWCCGASAVSDNLIAAGKIHGVIIVAMDDNNIDTHSELCNVIIPYIDSHYPTYADADHRGLYGYSLGGGSTFNEAFGYSSGLDTFHYISPTSAANFNHPSDADMFPNGGAVAKQKMKCLFISCGTGDWDGFYPPDQATHAYCVANNIPHGWLPVLGGGHDGGVWRPAMWNFLQMADAAGISDPPPARSACSQFEAANFDGQGGGGVVPETCSEGGQDIGTIQNGAYVVYHNVDFGAGANRFQARVASAGSGGNILLHLDSLTGTQVGTCAVPVNGAWQTWETESCSVSGASGVHELYLEFSGGSGYLFNVEWWVFNPTASQAAPPAPTGLTAAAGIERTALRWTASSGADSYNVKRAAASGGPYTPIANVAATNYTDTGVIGGTTYYYVTSALSMGGESTNSGQVSATPTVNLSSPWLSQDIGAGGLTGGESFTNGVFTVIGCGADVSEPSDQFRFVHLSTNGNCTVIARVTSASVEDINPWSKAGVMIRESLADNAANAFIAVTPGNGVTWQCRSSTGGVTSSNSASGLTAPCWVKLVHGGNTFTGSYSTDDVNWTQLGTATFTIASTGYVGLAGTSHDAYTLSTSTFDNVTAPGWAALPAATPTGLVATAATEEVTLRWKASSNATSYNVKQATHSGGPYTLIANVATTNFTNTDMVGRTTYYYVVSAENSLAGESANSAQVSAAPTVNVPLPWMTQDMGAVGVWGGAGLTNSVFTVTGSGNDIWNAADAFRFVYVATNSTNCTIIARVASLQNIDPWSKAGVMIRDSLDPGAANAFIAVTPGSGVTFQYRSSDGGSCANNNTTGLSAPYWVKLAQSGTTFTGYCSPDGVTWTVLGSATLTNVSTAYIGLAVTSHNNSSLCPATFDNVNCPGWSPTPLAVTALAVSGSQVNLTWNPVSNAISYDVKRSTSSGGTYVIIATGVTTTNYTDLGVSVSAGCYYIVSAIVRNGQTTNGPVAALSFPDLAGAIIGTPGSWNNDGGTIANVFDSNPATFFDGPDGSGDWVGLDFGAGVSNVITQINYCPRSGFESRMIAGVFQGANQAGFSDAVALATVGAQPATGVFTTADVGNASAFRYVRYLSPSGGFCNVAELQFYGCLFSIPVPPPASLGAFVLSSSQVSLVWRASSNATGYNLKRALASGGPYTIIASGVTTTNYTDSGLNSGTTYYYVVSALNSTGQSANSGRISATPVNLPQPRIVAACMAGGSLVFSGTNGSAGGSYTIWSTTNVATPFANWTQVGGGSFDGSGNFSATNLINASQTRQFYLLRQP